MFGILADYADIADQYNSSAITFEKFKELCENRNKQLDPNKPNIMTAINKQIISNK